MKMRNIILIGMPGCGKSTIGVLLAKTLHRRFVDTDLLIQAAEGRGLQQIIDAEGLDAFCALEERTILGLSCTDTVVATGGSAVYSERSMRHLAALGIIILLDVPYLILEGRLKHLQTRGVVKPRNVTLRELYDRRQPLYQRWATVTIPCRDLGHEAVVATIVQTLT